MPQSASATFPALIGSLVRSGLSALATGPTDCVVAAVNRQNLSDSDRNFAMRLMFRAAASLMIMTLASAPAAAQSQSWIHQFGSSSHDGIVAGAPNGSGGVFVGGFTNGSLGGPSAGSGDAWLAQYDNTGNQLWITQAGTTADEQILAAATDGLAGVIVGGKTRGPFGGPGPNGGFFDDAWLARYDGTGTRLWIRQFGTNSSDAVECIASDASGGAFVGGSTSGNLGGSSAGGQDIWLARYDSAGNRNWILQFGTNGSDRVTAITPDGSGGAVLCGYIGSGANGSQDIVIARYDSTGNRLWIQYLGTNEDDVAFAATGDGSGAVVVGGATRGSLGGLNSGDWDAWIARYDSAGNPTWIQQFGTSSVDILYYSAAPDGSGGAIVTGYTSGSLVGTNAGGADIWLARYDSTGNQLWIAQSGGADSEYPHFASTDGLGSVFIGGHANASFGGTSAGGQDCWLAQYAVGGVSTYCTAGTTTNGCAAAISVTGQPSQSFSAPCQINISNMEGNTMGLVFYSITGRQALAWNATSFLCIKAPTQRTPPQTSTGTNGLCDGSMALDWSAFQASNPTALGNPWSAGNKTQIQAWFRDPAAGKSTNLSNAVELTYLP